MDLKPLPSSLPPPPSSLKSWDPDFLARSPIFEPLRVHATAFGDDCPGLADMQRLLDGRNPPPHNTGGMPLRLVPHGRRSRAFEDGYEARLYLRGELQVRAGDWHDLFNVLVWLAFPLAKAALNARHYSALKSQTTPNRGPVQDALTLFDEGGVIVAASDQELLQMIREWRWKELFWGNRARLSARMRFCVFGHALYERALHPFIGRVGAWSRGPVLRGCDGGGAHEPTVSPDALQPTPGSHLPLQRQALLRRPSATGRGVLLDARPELLQAPLAELLVVLDTRIATYIRNPASLAATRELAVVPVLGVPGWCNGNELASFYDDTDYFRAGRTKEMRD